MERLKQTQSSGISRRGLRTWGMIFLAVGVLGRAIVQNRMLGLGSISAQELLEAMSTSSTTMIWATAALVMQAVETCAVPVFCFLLVEGFQRTANFGRYLLRVAGLACLSEVPYNLAMGGTLLDLSSWNPVFAMALCLAALYFYRRYSENSVANVTIKTLVTLAAFLWANMLGIEHGPACVVVVGVLWACRKLPTYRNFIGCAAAAVCCMFSMFYIASPMGFLPVHFYQGEQGEENRVANYLFYPVLLLAVWLAGKLLM